MFWELPFIGFVKVDKVEDSFVIINSRSKPLAAYLFTNDKALEKKFVNSISAGGMLINDTCLHVILLYSIHTCTHIIYIMILIIQPLKLPTWCYVMQLAVHTLPFGGVGESGMGSYHGKFSFDTFSHKKAVLYRSFGGDASARYPPYTLKKQRVLRALLNGDIIGLILTLIGWPRKWTLRLIVLRHIACASTLLIWPSASLSKFLWKWINEWKS